jgi:beta-glucanase (GH16 family)
MPVRLYLLMYVALHLAACDKTENTSGCRASDDSFTPVAPTGYCWTTVFSEDFDGTSLDTNKWIIWNGDREESISRNAAVSVKNGQLVIRQYFDSLSGRHVSAFVGTLGKFQQAYGFYSARIKVNKLPGWNAGFWLVGQKVDNVENEGVDGSEIDIIEMPFQDDRLMHALHWNGYGAEHEFIFKVLDRPDIKAGAFHEFSVWWSEEEYIFYIDGKETWRTKGGGISSDETTYLILSSEVNTHLAGPVENGSLPADYSVDWVRVCNLTPLE